MRILLQLHDTKTNAHISALQNSAKIMCFVCFFLHYAITLMPTRARLRISDACKSVHAQDFSLLLTQTETY